MFGRWCASQVSTRRICDARTESAAGWCASVQPISIGSRATVWPRYSGHQVKSQYKTLAVDNLVTGDGHRLPPRLACEIAREIQRLAMVQEQIAKIERERDTAPTPCEATERKRHLLLQLKSIGPAISALLSREVYYRQFGNRRQEGSFLS